jgi:hypothetical protein
MVTIEPGDAYFDTERCGSWYRYDGTGANKTTIAGDGIFVAGVDIASGSYETTGNECYWAILSDLSGDFSAIETNYIGSGPTHVTLQRGQYFESSGCHSRRRE